MTHKVTPLSLERHGPMALLLREALAQRGWSHSHLAQLLGGTATSSTVNNWIRAKHGIADTYRRKVAKLLDLDEARLRPRPRAPKARIGRPPKVATAPRQDLVVYQSKAPSAPPRTPAAAQGQAVVMVLPVEDARTFMLRLLKGE